MVEGGLDADGDQVYVRMPDHLSVVVEGQAGAVVLRRLLRRLPAGGAHRRQLVLRERQQGRQVGLHAPAVVDIGPDNPHPYFIPRHRTILELTSVELVARIEFPSGLYYPGSPPRLPGAPLSRALYWRPKAPSITFQTQGKSVALIAY